MPSRAAFLAFLKAIDCLPVTKRKRRPNPEKMAFLMNWTAICLARCFEAEDHEEFNELRRKMEAFLPGLINTGFEP